jgi:hypothetical protein
LVPLVQQVLDCLAQLAQLVLQVALWVRKAQQAQPVTTEPLVRKAYKVLPEPLAPQALLAYKE